MRYIATLGDREYVLDVVDQGRILVDGVLHQIDLEAVSGTPVHSLLLDGRSFQASVYPSDEGWKVLLHGVLYSIRVEDERERRLRAAAGDRVVEHAEFHLRSPMPGLVVSVPVQEGQQVRKGDVLVILESMKMQNELRSPRAGKVMRLRAKEGDSVEERQTLLSVV